MQKLPFTTVELTKPPRTKVSPITRKLLAEDQNEQILASLKAEFAKL